jgi:hypothetical protein
VERTTCGYIARVYISTHEAAAALCGMEECATDGTDQDGLGRRRPQGRGARERRNERRAALRHSG